MQKWNHRSFQRDYAKNPFGTGGKEGIKKLGELQKKWRLCTSHKGITGKEVENISNKYKNNQRVAFKNAHSPFKGRLWAFSHKSKELCEDFFVLICPFEMSF
ncbi:MAG: hypothetical protein ACLU9T_06780 [Blautia faecis]